MRYIKPIATALALSVGALTVSTAEAGDRGRRHHRHHNNGGEAAAAGIIGFAAGAILGGALSQPRYGNGYYDDRYYDDGYYAQPDVVYVQPRRVYTQRRPPTYAYALEPWSPEWYAYCESEYRSFEPSTGYYVTYGGKYRFCR